MMGEGLLVAGESLPVGVGSCRSMKVNNSRVQQVEGVEETHLTMCGLVAAARIVGLSGKWCLLWRRGPLVTDTP